MRSDDKYRSESDAEQLGAGQISNERLEKRLEAALAELDTGARQLARVQAEADTLRRKLSEVSGRLEHSRRQESRLLEELCDERRSSLRLLQEAQEEREVLETEIRDLRLLLGKLAPGSEPPRHSLVVQRDGSKQRDAETVRPPSVKPASGSSS